MKKITTIAAIILAFASTASFAATKLYGQLYSKETDTLGTYAQWTKHVAVTVKHVKSSDAIYVADCLDIQFIPREGTPPVWSDYKDTDEVYAIGNTVVEHANGRNYIEEATTSGKITPLKVLVTCNGIVTRTHTAEVKPGMSGSPLYRATGDHAALGINVATGIKGTEAEGTNEFIPTALIRQSWDYAVSNNLIPAQYLDQN